MDTSPIDEQKIKDYLFQAIQAGKKETSNLAGDILTRMQGQIEETVRMTVNGKIKEISKTLEQQNNVMGKHFNKVDIHMNADNEWKKIYTPYIKGLANLSDGGKVMVRIIIALSSVGAALLIIKSWFK